MDSKVFINKQQLALTDSCFYPTKQDKDLIVLHYTAGTTASGAWSSWKQRTDRVATAFIVDTNGWVFQTFNPSFWAWHLGLKGVDNESGKHDKRSIGLELVNFGPLMKKPDGYLYAWPKNYGTKFCHVDEKDKYICADWRGMQYHAAFTKEQLESTSALVKDLCSQFNIAPDVPKDPAAFNLELGKKWKGIATHSMFRSDKFDVGPAFDWTMLIEGLK